MKKFRISLGVLLQQNYEVEIEAENEEEAIKLGIEAFRVRIFNGDETGEIVDFDGAEARKDFDEDTKSGISAEEIDYEEDEREPELRRGFKIISNWCWDGVYQKDGILYGGAAGGGKSHAMRLIKWDDVAGHNILQGLKSREGVGQEE